MIFLFLLFFAAGGECAGNTWRNVGTSPTLAARHSLSVAALRRTAGTSSSVLFAHGGRDDVFNMRDVKSRAAAGESAWQAAHANGTAFRREHCAVAFNDATQMLVFGGTGSAAAADADSGAFLNALDVFTAASNAWAVLPTGPSGRAKMSCVVHRDSALLVFGGVTAQGRSAELWRFEFGARRWENLTPQLTGDVPQPISGHSATIVNNDTMLVFGGFRDATFEQREVRTLDLATLEWRLRTSPSVVQPLAREGHAAFAVNGGTQLVVFGGIANGVFLDDLWLHEPLSSAWAQLARTAGAPSRRAAAGVAAAQSGLAYVVGGTDGLLKNDVFEYTPPTCAPACQNFGLCDGTRCVCDSTGFTGAQCQTPVCTPACQNGGACVAPNTCRCDTATRNGKPAYGRLCEGYCGDRVLQSPQEACDDGNTAAGDCCVDCQPERFDAVCRAAAGACDVEERCEGRTTCAPDRFVNGTVCRPIAGPCDRAEQCDGAQAQCPGDAFVSAGTVCRAKDARNACDIDDTCSGAAAACPPDRFQPQGTPCSNNDTCTTGTDTCSSGGVCLSGPSTCNCNSPAECDDKNPCTVDSCVNRRCEHAAGNAGTMCRAAAGLCDIAEACDGALPFCPRDRVQMFGTQCRAAAGECDLPELCDGRSAECGADVKLRGDVCRRAAGSCDVEEVCDGVANQCPRDVLRANTTVCRASTSTCDPAEYCTGTSALCDSTNYYSPINSPCDDGDLCSTGDRCVRGGACIGDPVTPCARFDLPTPAPVTPAPGSPPGAPTPAPAPLDEAQACYLVRDNCELCVQLAACGYCATHGGKAGACNPEAVQQQCIDIGGTWNVPCDALALPPPTPPFTPVPTRPRPAPTPATPAPPLVPRTSEPATTQPLTRFSVVDPFASLSLPDIFKAGNGTDDGPLGLGWGYVGSVSLEWIFIAGIIIFLLICCCTFSIFALRVKRARDIGRGKRGR